MSPPYPLTGPAAWLAPRGSHAHNGIDLAGHEGAPVYAAGAGAVRHAVTEYAPGFGGYGQTVTIAHDDGSHTLYAHLSRVLVQPGQRLAAGELLGSVGRTAYTADDPAALTRAPHVHFEASAKPYPLRSDEGRLDPVEYLTAPGRVNPRAPSLSFFSARPISPSSYPFGLEPVPSSSTWPISPPTPPRWLWFALVAGITLVIATRDIATRHRP